MRTCRVIAEYAGFYSGGKPMYFAKGFEGHQNLEEPMSMDSMKKIFGNSLEIKIIGADE